MGISTRFIELADVGQVLEAEAALNRHHAVDPDFGEIDCPAPWALGEAGLVRLLAQRNDDKRGTSETRGYVAQTTRLGKSEGGVVRAPWVCAGMCYEKRERSYLIVWLTAHPLGPVAAAVAALLRELKGKAHRSAKRKRIELVLRDRDEAGLRLLLPVVMQEGLTVRLAPGHYADCDGWLCTYESP